MSKKKKSSEPVNILPGPGLRILKLRKKLGFSREKFEKITGMSASTVRYFETGKREVPVLKARLLATIFIYRFDLKEEEASEDFILHGKQEEESS